MAKLSEPSQQSPSPPPAPPRRQAHRKAREKKVTTWEEGQRAVCADQIVLPGLTCSVLEPCSVGPVTVSLLLALIISLMHPPLSLPFQARGRKSQRLSKAAETSTQRGNSKKKKAVTVDFPKLKSQYGVDAWKRWIQWRRTQPNLEKPRYGCKSERIGNATTTAELEHVLHMYSQKMIWSFHILA